MDREETKFKMNISDKDAQALSNQGRSSQSNRGVEPTDKALSSGKLPNPTEEKQLEAAGRSSQEKRKDEK